MEIITITDSKHPIHTGDEDDFYDATRENFFQAVRNKKFDGTYADFLHCLKWDLVKTETIGMPYKCTVYDRCEGKLHITVHADDDDNASELAGIAASERGCSNITEVIVGVFE